MDCLRLSAGPGVRWRIVLAGLMSARLGQTKPHQWLSPVPDVFRERTTWGAVLPRPRLVSGGHRQRDAFLSEHLPNVLEPFILRDRDGTGVDLALELARWILQISRHQFLDRLAHRDHCPGPLGIIVHEDVVALLRILPEVEQLRDGRDILARPLPTQVGVDREAASGGTVVAAQVEHGLVVIHAHGAGGQLVLGERGPGGWPGTGPPEQARAYVLAGENGGLTLTILLRQLGAPDGGER